MKIVYDFIHYSATNPRFSARNPLEPVARKPLLLSAFKIHQELKNSPFENRK